MRARLEKWAEQLLVDPPNLGFFRWWFDALYLRPRFRLTAKCTFYNLERLPTQGRVILIANHLSLFDAVLVQICYPLRMLSRIRASAARDYFEKKSFIQRFMAGSMMRLLYLDRESGEAAKAGKVDPFASLHAPIKNGDMVIVFPSGSRDRKEFRPGIHHLVTIHPDAVVIPICIAGTDKFHPKGVSFWTMRTKHPISMWVGEPFPFDPMLSPREYAEALQEYVYSLGGQDNQ
jgi:1-acyl-sn-glycerol-3-phosphate acyltransferase